MKALLVDDSKPARLLLAAMILELCPDVQIIGNAENVDIAVDLIKEHKPDLIFLDIEMPGKSGLQLVEQLSKDEVNFEIIFTTAFNQYALQAFRLSAIDYLLKPIREKELIDAVEKVRKRIEVSHAKNRLEALVSNLKIENQNTLCIPINYGFEFIAISKIEYIEADGSYSHIYMEDGKKITISKNLKYLNDRIGGLSNFVKVHRSCIVNLAYLQSFYKSDRGTIKMNSGVEIALSRTCRQDFLNAIELLEK